MRGTHVLAVGAHPDDIEIGALGLISRLLGAGAVVTFLILSDEADHPEERREEARGAAATLGVNDILFCGLRDGHIRANGDNVRRVREYLKRSAVWPDLVIVHSEADSHNDHVEASRLLRAAIRSAAFLHYPIHISAELSEFSPDFWIAMDASAIELKKRTLRIFQSQKARIEKNDLDKFHRQLGREIKMSETEAFELRIQLGAEYLVKRLQSLNDNKFVQFWNNIVVNGRVDLLYSDWPSSVESLLLENSGRDALREAFSGFWWGKSPLKELNVDSWNESSILKRNRSFVIVGGPRTNSRTKEIYQSGMFLDYRRTEIPLNYGLNWRGQFQSARDAVFFDVSSSWVHIYMVRKPCGAVILGVSGSDGKAIKAGLLMLSTSSISDSVMQFNKVHRRGELFFTVNRENEDHGKAKLIGEYID